MHRLESSIRSRGFSLLKDIDPKQLTGFLQNEHPQTISLILTQLSANQAAAIMSELSPELQAEVSLRIATMEKISPDVLQRNRADAREALRRIGRGRCRRRAAPRQSPKFST